MRRASMRFVGVLGQEPHRCRSGLGVSAELSHHLRGEQKIMLAPG